MNINRMTIGIILGVSLATPSAVVSMVRAGAPTKVLAIVRYSPTLPPTPTSAPTPALSPQPKPRPSPRSTPKPTATPTSTATPIPTPIPVMDAQLDEWLTNAANHYSVDRERLRTIAICESGLQVNAVNGPYVGLYQFSPDTWRSVRSRMGMDPDVNLRMNAEESIRTAAFAISTDGLTAWHNCSK